MNFYITDQILLHFPFAQPASSLDHMLITAMNAKSIDIIGLPARLTRGRRNIAHHIFKLVAYRHRRAGVWQLNLRKPSRFFLFLFICVPLTIHLRPCLCHGGGQYSKEPNLLLIQAVKCQFMPILSGILVSAHYLSGSEADIKSVVYRLEGRVAKNGNMRSEAC